MFKNAGHLRVHLTTCTNDIKAERYIQSSSPCETHKLQKRNIPHTIIKFIANYIQGRKAYITFRNKTSTQRQLKNGVPQGGVLSPTLFNIYTSDTPNPHESVKLTTYADDITITSTHNDINIAKAQANI